MFKKKGRKDFFCLGFLIVLILSGCYNKIPQTGWLINNRNLFLTVLEAGSQRSGHQHGQVRTCFPVHSWHLGGWD